MTTADQNSMTSTTGISVTADAAFSFSHITSNISKAVTQELQVTQSTSTELMTEQENTECVQNNNYEIA